MRDFKVQDGSILHVVKLKGQCRAGKDKMTPWSTWPIGKLGNWPGTQGCCGASTMGKVIFINQ